MACFAPLQADEPPVPIVRAERLAREVAGDLATEAFGKVSARFNARMKTQLSTEKLSTVWHQLTARLGAFKSITAASTDGFDSFQRVALTCTFERDEALLTIVFDTDQKIAGLMVTSVPVAVAPLTAAPAWTPPGSATPAARQELEAAGGGRFALRK